VNARSSWSSALAFVAIAGLFPLHAAAHTRGAILYGSGTAAVDGTLALGEWQNARALTFQASRPPNDGGGTMPVTVREMNDAANVYLSFEIGRGTYGGATQALLYFDNNHDGAIAEGDEHFAADVGIYSPVNFIDGFWTACTPGGPPSCPSRDTDYGGTNDGLAAASANGTTTVLEISHPLDDADNAHDWSLSAGQVVGFSSVMNIFSETPSCNLGPNCQVLTIFPNGSLNGTSSLGYGDLVVAPDTIPPETAISDGPAKLTRSATASFEFSGSDNLTPSEQIGFSCSLDGSAYAGCSQPLSVSGGVHRLAVRASDELGNVDATPAEYRWRVDLTRPGTPSIRLRLAGNRLRVVLAARDRDDKPRTLKFQCALDRPKLRACPSSFSRAVRRGRHLLRVRALDPAGNASAIASTRFRR
jgi:hypothetical protein